MKKVIVAVLLYLLAIACKDSAQNHPISEEEKVLFDKAHENGMAANEGFSRSKNFVQGWLRHSDPGSGLIPRNLKDDTDIWNAKDAAADNYPFMVLTAFFVDRPLFEGKMVDMLRSEKQLTSRVNTLPDTYSFSKKDFQNPEIDMGSIVFGTSEYIKDGLLPLTEWLGESEWSDRMIEMLYDLKNEVAIAGQIDRSGKTNASREEVNGELLQILSRIYWMTGDEQFLDWGLKIGDHYLLGNNHPTRNLDYLRLRDHGCELISGLCELYVTTNYARPAKKEAYQKPLHEMLDRILEVGRNPDGLFYDGINPRTGEIIQERIADNWGYTLNGYYAIAQLDNKPAYKEAIRKVFSNLHKYTNYDWENGSSDGYADAIESALNLYNRMPDPAVAKWMDSETQVMWGKQQDDGTIEGWHGDGNFARTTIMYNLWKSKGVYVQPWREDIVVGAEQKGDSLLLSIQTQNPWAGKLYFDTPRSKETMNMPIDWPRINQFPEWFTVKKDSSYQVFDSDTQKADAFQGMQLSEGIDIEIDQTKKLIVF